MEVTLKIQPDDFDQEAYDRSIADFMEIVERPDDVRITITPDYVEAVREKLSDKEYAATYQQERRLATAAAKTITQDDGTTDVVVAVGLLSKQQPPGVAERSFRHEALHVAISQRNENLNDIRLRQGIGDTSAGLYLAMGGVASEEYRVERALRNQRAETITSAFGDIAIGLDESIREAVESYKQDGDLSTLSLAVRDNVHATATWTAYVAAECDGDEPEIGVPADVDQRVLGEPWRAVVAALHQVPAADVPTDRAELDRVAEQVALAITRWIMYIGFMWIDEGEYIDLRTSNENPWGL